jgi:hypothetical protein
MLVLQNRVCERPDFADYAVSVHPPIRASPAAETQIAGALINAIDTLATNLSSGNYQAELGSLNFLDRNTSRQNSN